MKTIETVATVTPEGTLTVQVPSDIPPGEHEVVVVIEEQLIGKKPRAPLELTGRLVGLEADSFTYRREDLYGDEGR